MPDFQTEIRNEKLQDIKQELYLLRYDIWSGAITGFLGGANYICAILEVYRHFETTYPSQNVWTKLPIYAAQNP
jgi:high-affinity Fe2+/Pb2+ permease